MHTEVEPIVTRLQQDVPAAEARIDDAMIALLSLTTSGVAARRDTAGVPAAKGHGMIQRTDKAQKARVDIRGEVFSVQGGLVRIGRETAGHDLPQASPPQETADG